MSESTDLIHVVCSIVNDPVGIYVQTIDGSNGSVIRTSPIFQTKEYAEYYITQLLEVLACVIKNDGGQIRVMTNNSIQAELPRSVVDQFAIELFKEINKKKESLDIFNTPIKSPYFYAAVVQSNDTGKFGVVILTVQHGLVLQPLHWVDSEKESIIIFEEKIEEYRRALISKGFKNGYELNIPEDILTLYGIKRKDPTFIDQRLRIKQHELN